jgi:hypothetical protein
VLPKIRPGMRCYLSQPTLASTFIGAASREILASRFSCIIGNKFDFKLATAITNDLRLACFGVVENLAYARFRINPRPFFLVPHPAHTPKLDSHYTLPVSS